MEGIRLPPKTTQYLVRVIAKEMGVRETPILESNARTLKKESRDFEGHSLKGVGLLFQLFSLLNYNYFFLFDLFDLIFITLIFEIVIIE